MDQRLHSRISQVKPVSGDIEGVALAPVTARLAAYLPFSLHQHELTAAQVIRGGETREPRPEDEHRRCVV